jgi:hypothetical protein
MMLDEFKVGKLQMPKKIDDMMHMCILVSNATSLKFQPVDTKYDRFRNEYTLIVNPDGDEALFAQALSATGLFRADYQKDGSVWISFNHDRVEKGDKPVLRTVVTLFKNNNKWDHSTTLIGFLKKDGRIVPPFGGDPDVTPRNSDTKSFAELDRMSIDERIHKSAEFHFEIGDHEREQFSFVDVRSYEVFSGFSKEDGTAIIDYLPSEEWEEMVKKMAAAHE